MNFGLDVRPTLSRPTGVGTYVQALVERLPALAPEDRFHFFSASLKERYPSRAWPANVRLVDRRLPVAGLNLAWNRAGWPPLDRLVGASLDLVHSPSPLLVPCRKGKRVVTLHDLFFLKHPDMVEGETRRDFVTLVRDHVRRADGVLCVSEYTAAEARRLLDVPEEKIAVTPHGVDPVYREAPSARKVEETLRRLRLPTGGILYVGSAEKRKNLVTLVMAYMTLARAAPPPAPRPRRSRLRVGPGGQPGGAPDRGDGLPDPGGRPRPDGGLLHARPALARGGLRPSRRRGDGRGPARRLLERLGSRRGGRRRGLPRRTPRRQRPGPRRRAPARRPALAEEMRRRGLERSRRFDWGESARKTLAFYRKVLGR